MNFLKSTLHFSIVTGAPDKPDKVENLAQGPNVLKTPLKEPKVSHPKGTFKCEICKIETTDAKGLDIHKLGKKHLKMANKIAR